MSRTPYALRPRSAPRSTPLSVDHINLRGMRFHALIGVLPYEREIRQPLEVDLCVDVPNVSGDLLDYRLLYDAAAAVLSAGHIDYIEQVAEGIAARALTISREIRAVRVTVRKPHVPLPGPLQYAEVVVNRNAPA